MEDDVEVELELEKQLSLAHEMFWHDDDSAAITDQGLLTGNFRNLNIWWYNAESEIEI